MAKATFAKTTVTCDVCGKQWEDGRHRSFHVEREGPITWGDAPEWDACSAYCLKALAQRETAARKEDP